MHYTTRQSVLHCEAGFSKWVRNRHRFQRRYIAATWYTLACAGLLTNKHHLSQGTYIVVWFQFEHLHIWHGHRINSSTPNKLPQTSKHLYFKQKKQHLKNIRKLRSKNGHTVPSMLPGISIVQTKDTTLFHPEFSPLQSVIVEDPPNPVLKRCDTTAPLTHPLEVSKKHHLDNESGLVKLWRNTSRMRVLSSNGGKKMTCWGNDFWYILCIFKFICTYSYLYNFTHRL